MQCRVPNSCPPKTCSVTLGLGGWNTLLPISRKRGNSSCKCWRNDFLQRCPQGTGRAEARPLLQGTFRGFLIVTNLEISPYAAQILRHYIHLAATLNLGSRNPKYSLNLMESNLAFSREEESLLLKMKFAFSGSVSSGIQGSPPKGWGPGAGEGKSCQLCWVGHRTNFDSVGNGE